MAADDLRGLKQILVRGRSGYCGAVSARHRGKADHWSPIALILALGPLAGLGLLIFVGIKHPSVILLFVGACDGVFLIQAVHRLVLNLADKQPQTPEQMVDRISLIAQLAGTAVIVVAFIGQIRGWMHGTFRDVIVGVLVIYLLAAPIYWYGGRRRLIGMLRTWDTGGEQG